MVSSFFLRVMSFCVCAAPPIRAYPIQPPHAHAFGEKNAEGDTLGLRKSPNACTKLGGHQVSFDNTSKGKACNESKTQLAPLVHIRVSQTCSESKTQLAPLGHIRNHSDMQAN